jgi:hypothetical protein
MIDSLKSISLQLPNQNDSGIDLFIKTEESFMDKIS